MTPPVRVLLADDQALLRESLATVLAADGRIEVVGAVADGRAAVAAVQERAVDVVLGTSACPSWTASPPPSRSCGSARAPACWR
ncbi:hypothetical protein [Cellulomonas sp. ES6]|uniref:response regulator transcription factor n=1 Tax=Cellulomonas sp. ES6 TaxID=3039384 RepID=UPI0032D573D8